MLACRRVYTHKAARITRDTMTHHVMRYYVMDMDTNQVVQVIIVVNTAIIIEMGMLQDGMLRLVQIIMKIVRADQVMVALLVRNRNHRQHLT
jgi:hypothetical protein